MAFFHNRAVNLINLHAAVTAIAMSGGGAFWSVYLLKAGISIPGVLFAAAATFGLRFVLRSGLLLLAVRIGLRWLVAVGSLLMALSFPLVAEVQGVGWV
ncbi:MAG TPA: hypothetical protein VGC36_09520, partial [Rhizomicrobium sp.]